VKTKTPPKQTPPTSTRRTVLPLLVGIFILAILAAIAIPIYLTFSNMTARLASSPSGVSAGITPGAQAKFVCQVTSTSTNNLIHGTILAVNSDGSYSPTRQTVSIQWNPSQGVVMGSSQDVRQGAVIQVSGPTDGNGAVHANQIVILTGYVTVH
jgi:hypothetical protein